MILLDQLISMSFICQILLGWQDTFTFTVFDTAYDKNGSL